MFYFKRFLRDPLEIFLLKGYSTFFGNIGSFYKSPRVKQLSFTVLQSIQPIF